MTDPSASGPASAPESEENPPQESMTEVSADAKKNDDDAPMKEDPVKKTEQDTIQKNDTATADDKTDGIDDNKKLNYWDNADRRVVLHNVMRYLDAAKATKQAKELAERASKVTGTPIAVDKCRKPPKDSFMVVTLETPAMVRPFLEFIQNPDNKVVNKKGGQIMAKAAWEDNQSKNKRKRNDNGDDESNNNIHNKKRQHPDRNNTNPNQPQTPLTLTDIRNKITPLHTMTQAEQEHAKMMNMVRKCAMAMVKEIKARFRKLGQDKTRRASKNARKGQRPDHQPYAWLQEKRCIPMHPIQGVPTPLRNKVEFTFGFRYEYEQGEQQDGPKAKDDNANTTSTTDENNTDDTTMKLEEKDTKEKEGNKTAAQEESTAETVTKKEEEVKMETETPAPDGSDAKQPEADGDVAMKEAASSSEKPPKEKSEITKNGDKAATTTESAAAESKGSAAEPTRKIRKLPSLGFMPTGWSGGVGKPHGCANISSEMCAIVDVLEAFLQDSPLPPYEPRSHTGFWRYLTIRTSRRTKQCMIILGHAPTTGAAGEKFDDKVDYSAPWKTERERLIETLQAAEFPVRSETGTDLGYTLKVTSFFLQEFAGLSNPPPDHPVQHVFGKTVLEEQLGKCTFQISPGAFFQVNTPGAELLYQIVMDRLTEYIEQREKTRKEECEKRGDSTKEYQRKKNVLFDVCCGTGTIGLACMKEGIVDRVVGVDISEPAIEDAKRNAKLNGFDPETQEKEGSSKNDEPQTRFVASRAEAVMSQEIQRASNHPNSSSGGGHRFLAVVDPAREGLHSEVVRNLRNAREIQRIVYVSCNPTGSLVRDAGLLCCPQTKKYAGVPFRPTSAYPVDMFPFTDHCELVMTFDRCTKADMDGNPSSSEEKK